MDIDVVDDTQSKRCKHYMHNVNKYKIQVHVHVYTPTVILAQLFSSNPKTSFLPNLSINFD